MGKPLVRLICLLQTPPTEQPFIVPCCARVRRAALSDLVLRPLGTHLWRGRLGLE